AILLMQHDVELPYRTNANSYSASASRSLTLAAYLFGSVSPSAACPLPAVPPPASPNTAESALTLSGRPPSSPHTPTIADVESNRNTLSGPHRKRLDSPPPNASVFPSGHHGPTFHFGIRNYNPESPLRRSVPKSEMSPSGRRDPESSGCPVAAAFHSLSRSIHDAPLPAGMFSASAPARFRPEIAVLRLRSPQSP